ncbi:zinc finger protein 570-like [Centropristis striata]|uniref:zinc finger protein 570-like n=1 Tax=Centropristis striata TaxID=184440 RepID=UPI0027DEDACE|nr:zinc finger protein 570-like [Centropristis striata]
MPSADYFKEFVNERLAAAAEEILGVFIKTIVEYKEEIDRQRRLLDIAWKPEIKLHRIELPQQHFCKEEEVPADQQLCIQERNSSLDQEDPEPPQVKEEPEELSISQEGEQLVVKQETPTYEESDLSEDQTMYLKPDDTLSSVETESVFTIPVISSALHDATSDHQLLSDVQAEPKQQNRPHETRIHFNNVTSLYVDQEDPEPPQIKEQKELCTSQQGEQLVVNQETPTYEENDHSEVQTGAEPKQQETRSHINNVSSPNLSEDNCNTDKGKKPLKCDTCGKEFKIKSRLKRHLKTHTGEKPYACNTCGKRLADCSTYKMHMRIHTGEKPFECKICGFVFRQSTHLKNHMSSHTGESRFTCKVCGKAFRRKDYLNKHMVRFHILSKLEKVSK